MKHFNFLLILVILIAFVALVACAPNEGSIVKDDGTRENSLTPILKVKDLFVNNARKNFIIEDTETGVEYICVQTSTGFAITPRIGKTTPKVER